VVSSPVELESVPRVGSSAQDTSPDVLVKVALNVTGADPASRLRLVGVIVSAGGVLSGPLHVPAVSKRMRRGIKSDWQCFMASLFSVRALFNY
jgi:hypothetical protein